MKNARFHSIEPNDISRYYQNACDIEAEMSNFQLAFSHLYNGAIIWKEQRVDCENEIHISTSKSDEIERIISTKLD